MSKGIIRNLDIVFAIVGIFCCYLIQKTINLFSIELQHYNSPFNFLVAFGCTALFLNIIEILLFFKRHPGKTKDLLCYQLPSFQCKQAIYWQLLQVLFNPFTSEFCNFQFSCMSDVLVNNFSSNFIHVCKSRYFCLQLTIKNILMAIIVSLYSLLSAFEKHHTLY